MKDVSFLDKKNKVCKLIKYFYDLKQSPKQWHEKFDQVLMKDIFSSNEVDKYVYTEIVDNDCDNMLICWWYAYFWELKSQGVKMV